MPDKSGFWFPAKLYGRGRGYPTVWQGWLFWACYALSIAALFYFAPPATHALLHALFFIGLSLLLVVICWLKGEPTRWRWGK